MPVAASCRQGVGGQDGQPLMLSAPFDVTLSTKAIFG